MMYHTAQRELLLDFLDAHYDRSFSAGEIQTELEKTGECTISLSAIYRNLAKLEQEGRIQKFAGRRVRESRYRCVGHKRCGDSIHMVCLACGKSRHLEEGVAEFLCGETLRDSGFEVARKRTFIYGLCEECRKGNHAVLKTGK